MGQIRHPIDRFHLHKCTAALLGVSLEPSQGRTPTQKGSKTNSLGLFCHASGCQTGDLDKSNEGSICPLAAMQTHQRAAQTIKAIVSRPLLIFPANPCIPIWSGSFRGYPFQGDLKGNQQETHRFVRSPLRQTHILWLWVKIGTPNGTLVSGKHGPTPAAFWWFNFDPYPCFCLTTHTVSGARAVSSFCCRMARISPS